MVRFFFCDSLHRYIEIFRSTASELRRSMFQIVGGDNDNGNGNGGNNMGGNMGGGNMGGGMGNNRPSPYDRNDRNNRMGGGGMGGNARQMRGVGNDRRGGGGGGGKDAEVLGLNPLTYLSLFTCLRSIHGSMGRQ